MAPTDPRKARITAARNILWNVVIALVVVGYIAGCFIAILLWATSQLA